MAQSLSKVYVHLVFSTKYRMPMIGDDVKDELWAYIGGICKALECQPLQVGGYKDHAHILCQLSRKITMAKLVEEVKKQSSKWIKTKSRAYQHFYWQGGYAIFSVRPSEVHVVERYIKNQEAHHRKQSFEKELISTLEKYKVEYDERYLWD